MSDPSMHWLSLFPLGARTAAFPSRDRPRLVVRVDGPVPPAVLVRFFPAWRASARLYRAWLRIRARMTPAQTRVLPRAGSLEPVVRELCPRAEVAAVLPDRNGRSRAVAVALNRAGGVVAYLKYGWSDAESRHLTREASMVGMLPEGIGPRLLGSAKIADGLLLALAPLNGTPVAARLPPPPDLVGFLRVLERERLPGLEHSKILALADVGTVGTAQRWLEALAGLELPLGFSHGDLAPWNLLRVDRRLVALDWERGEADGIPWLDLAYYVLQTAALMHGWSPPKAVSFGIRYLTRALTVDAVQARAVLAFSAYAAWAAAAGEGTHDNAALQAWRRAVWTDSSCAA